MTATPAHSTATPRVVDRQTWLRERNGLLVREKVHTREGDAIAAARRRLPMTLVPTVTVQGPGGDTPLVEVFEGRRMLIAYFHMWHEGKPFEDQCEGCTFSTCHMQMLDYLHARDVTYAVFCQGPYDDSAAFAEFMGYTFPWYWTTGRGVEALTTSYHALDLTAYGRQEDWENSPEGWPRVSGHPWRLNGRPIAQWSRPGVAPAVTS